MSQHFGNFNASFLFYIESLRLRLYRYKKNMVARSRILRDQPLNPVETAIYWAEFVLRHNDTSSFKPMALDQPVYVRLMLDAFFTIAFLIMGLPLAIMYCVILCIRKVVS